MYSALSSKHTHSPAQAGVADLVTEGVWVEYSSLFSTFRFTAGRCSQAIPKNVPLLFLNMSRPSLSHSQELLDTSLPLIFWHHDYGQKQELGWAGKLLHAKALASHLTYSSSNRPRVGGVDFCGVDFCEQDLRNFPTPLANVKIFNRKARASGCLPCRACHVVRRPGLSSESIESTESCLPSCLHNCNLQLHPTSNQATRQPGNHVFLSSGQLQTSLTSRIAPDNRLRCQA